MSYFDRKSSVQLNEMVRGIIFIFIKHIYIGKKEQFITLFSTERRRRSKGFFLRPLFKTHPKLPFEKMGISHNNMKKLQTYAAFIHNFDF